jgi:hypothetical protein
MKFFNYVLSRLKENTTWAGIFVIASHFGLTFTPEETIAITGLIITILPNSF